MRDVFIATFSAVWTIRQTEAHALPSQRNILGYYEAENSLVDVNA
jgi:hypothetical protein